MKVSLDKKILAGFLASAIVLIFVALYSFNNSEKVVASDKLVEHTQKVRFGFEKILKTSVDLETGARGYIITHSDNYLEPFEQAKADILSYIDSVRILTSDNQQQQNNINVLSQLVANSIKYHTECIQLLKTKSVDTVAAFIVKGSGKNIEDSIRRIITRAEGIEGALLIQRKVASEEDTRNFNIVFIVLIAIIAIVLLSVYVIINTNLRALRRAEKEAADKNWNLTGSGELVRNMQGNTDVPSLARIIITHLASFLGAQLGAIYLTEENTTDVKLAAGYAIDKLKKQTPVIKTGEGLVGQAVLENKKMLLKDVPGDYFKINSGLGEVIPKNIIVVPFSFEGRVKGVLEMASIDEFTPLQQGFLSIVADNIGIAVSAAQERHKTKELLEETQRQSEELQAQQEELKQANEELQEKTELLEKSEEELRAQQEELQQSNEELEEKAGLLEEQKERLEGAKVDIENKANELEMTGKYKSEFLANMSHELRTPLNSILILAQLLSENKSKKLSEKEIEFAKNIYNSGSDLLNLINEILDLSKVESGKMELDVEEVSCKDVVSGISSMFTELAKNKSIQFSAEIGSGVKSMITDKQRLEQILRNLLSNAFKFTDKAGKVTLAISKVSSTLTFRSSKLNNAKDVISFTVSDTGIGIPLNKQELIFEAFQQADGSTKRKYGGTGLGLSISRELCNALGGEIHLKSIEGEGSTFALYLPVKFDSTLVTLTNKKVEVIDMTGREVPKAEASFKEQDGKPENFEVNVADDRNNIKENDKVILILEDDEKFARTLLDFVRERHYKGIIAGQGNTGMSYARQFKPDAILLDINLPLMDGTEVLKQLKNDPNLRHIPVQIISAHDKRKEGMELGAFDFIKKPISLLDLRNAFDKIESFVSKKLKKLLIIEDNKRQNEAIRELVGNGDVKSYSAYSGNEALEMMQKEVFDCIIVDLGLPDMPGFDLLEKIKSNESLNKIPVIVYTGRDLKKEESMQLSRLANTVVLKTADSKERLLDETILFLHRVESKLPREKQNIIRKLHKTDEVLQDKKILIVDDDIRNIYSLTNALEEEGLHCVIAENGKVALKVLEENPDIDLVLMDIMMPEMDGYDATKEIRKTKKFGSLPIIALTAKAMKGDKEKCLAIGMSDYIAKPVNIEQLLSLMRVWLYK